MKALFFNSLDYKKRLPKLVRQPLEIAEAQGFEPWVPVRVQRFSRPSRSTTPANFLFVFDSDAKLVIFFQLHAHYAAFFET